MKKRNLLHTLQRKKTPLPDAVVGVCWYSPQDWQRVKAAATDPELFENSFADWETMANESFALIRSAYPNALKVPISADEFFAWCHGRGRSNNSTARSEFVSEHLSQPGSGVT